MLFHAAYHLRQPSEFLVTSEMLAKFDLLTQRRFVATAQCHTPRLRLLCRILNVLCDFDGFFTEACFGLSLGARQVVLQLLGLLSQPRFFSSGFAGQFVGGVLK